MVTAPSILLQLEWKALTLLRALPIHFYENVITRYK